MSKNMLINAQHTGQVRVAIVDGTTLESYQVDVAESGLTRGNIYRGVVANIQPSLNAAFVDLGDEKHGFLSLDDIEPAAWQKKPPEEGGRPRIEQVLERKKPILVQVTKDGMGSKGPALTTNLSLAGRYLVMMPLDTVRGISRKIEDDVVRKTVKSRLAKLSVPEGMGVIVRTNGLDQTQAMLNRDLNALLRLWSRIEAEARTGKGPRLLYNDQDLILQALRDFLDTTIGHVIVDTDEAFARSERFMQTFMPRSKTDLVRYEERLPLFSRYHLENQIDRIYSRSVPLESGGSIVIDPTEALTAIDVNSGRATKKADHDESILTVNLEAADEVGRQLRLRDIGGLVVIDFIDMRLRKHQRKVEKAMRDALKVDRARHTVSKISANGLVEINRQRLKQALRSRIHRSCPTCDGVGSIPSLEFSAISLLRRIEARAATGNLAGVVVGLHPEVADALQNHHRREIAELEAEFDLRIEVIAAASLHRTEERVEWKQDREGGQRTPDSRALTAVDLASAATSWRRRRGGAGRSLETSIEAPSESTAPEPAEAASADESMEPRPKRRRRRGGRGRRKGRSQAEAGAEPTRTESGQEAGDRAPRAAMARNGGANERTAPDGAAIPRERQDEFGPVKAEERAGQDRPAPAKPEQDRTTPNRAAPTDKQGRRKRGGRSRTKGRGGKTKIVVHEEGGYIDDNSQLRFFGAAKPGEPSNVPVPSARQSGVDGSRRRGGRRGSKPRPEPYIGPMAPAGATPRPRPGAFGAAMTNGQPLDDTAGNRAPGAPAADADHADPQPGLEAKPTRARRGGRRKKADDEAMPQPETVVAEGAEPGEATVADEKPKRARRGGSRKKAEAASQQASPLTEAAETGEAEAEAKPKRARRTTRRKKTDDEPGQKASPPAEAEADAGGGEPVAEKPKRARRTTRRKKTDDEAGQKASGPEGDDGETATEKPKRVRRGGRTKKAEDEAQDATPQHSPPPPPDADAVVADAPWPWWRSSAQPPPGDGDEG